MGPARVGECDIGSRQGCRPPAVLSPPCMKEKMMWSLVESLTTSIAGALRAKQSAYSSSNYRIGEGACYHLPRHAICFIAFQSGSWLSSQSGLGIACY